MFLISCTQNETVYFTGSQPKGVHSLQSFSKKDRGCYKSCNEKPIEILITKHNVVKQTNIETKIHIHDVDLEGVDANNEVEFQVIGDSVEVKTIILDTLFSPSSSQVLKKFKNRYYLSYQIDTKKWRVEQLTIQSDTLRFSKIIPSEQLMDYSFVTLSNEKPKEYLLSLTKAEFRLLLKEGRFSENKKSFVK